MHNKKDDGIGNWGGFGNVRRETSIPEGVTESRCQ
jgi:hypothetical protein